MTGGRVRKIATVRRRRCLSVTYGDGVSDVDIRDLVEFHKSHGKLATVTTVPPTSRFGMLDMAENDRVRAFIEKPKTDGWMSAGFFVFESPGLRLPGRRRVHLRTRTAGTAGRATAS